MISSLYKNTVKFIHRLWKTGASYPQIDKK